MPRFARAEWQVDSLLAVGLFAVVVTGVVLEDGHPGRWPIVLLVILCAPLAARRRRPATVLVLCLAASAVYQALGYQQEPAMVPLLVALYTVAAEPLQRRAITVGGAFLTSAVFFIGWSPSSSPQQIVGALSWTGLAVAVGEVSKAHKLSVSAAAERAARAERMQQAEAARRTAETNRRIAEERLGIARDLHDILSHSISVINVQASVAAHLATTTDSHRNHDNLVAAISTIAEESRKSMAELRTTLGVLRTTSSAEPVLAPEDERSPTPGLARLPDLLVAAHDRGIEVQSESIGTPPPLPPTIDVTAYRVMQEALTNVARHAPGAAARLVIEYRESLLRIEVLDSGPARTTPTPPEDHDGSGYGLVGMRERVAAVGGTVQTGAREGGGFAVCVTLPLPAATTRPSESLEEQQG